LRVGLLEQDRSSIFCLVKNISSLGVRVKPYGHVRLGTSVRLRLGDEDPVEGSVAWASDGLAGIQFEFALNPETLLRIAQKMVGQKRRTAPRIAIEVQACLRTAGRSHRATLCDVSMLGARIRTDLPVTFGETMIIEVPGIPSLRAYARWTRGLECGLSFEKPLSMQIIAEVLQHSAHTAAPRE
jgi:hypothetical protein